MKSFLKFLSRNKLFTSIEGIGLIVSFAFVILIGTYVVRQYEIVYENPRRDSIFTVSSDQAFALGYWDKESIDARIPEVEASSRLAIDQEVVGHDGEKELVKLMDIDPEFFKIFPYYRFSEGSPAVLDDPSNILISRSYASRLSQDGKSPVGKVITIGGEGNFTGEKKNYVVAGIVDDFKNTLFQYTDIIRNISNDAFEVETDEKFGTIGNFLTFVEVPEGTDRETFAGKIAALCRQNYGDWVDARLYSLDEAFFCNKGNYYLNCADKSALWILATVVLLLLVSSIINYVNLNLAMTGKRVREMATRMLVGSSRAGVFWKIIFESVFFTFVCGVLALILSFSLEPIMNNLISGAFTAGGTNQDYTQYVPIDLHLSAGFVCAFAGGVLLIGGLAGLLPAISALKFSPIDVVRGSFRSRSKMVFSKIFIVFQGTISVILIAISILMSLQMRHMMQRPLNADTADLYFLRDGNYATVSELEPLLDKLRALPCVKEIGFSGGTPAGFNMGVGIMKEDSTEVSVQTCICDSVFFRLIAPRVVKDFGLPLTGTVWFGESAYNALGINESNSLKYAQKFNNLNRSVCNGIGGIIKDIPTSGAADSERNQNCALLVQKPENLVYSNGMLIKTTGETTEVKKSIDNAYAEFINETDAIGSRPDADDFVDVIIHRTLDNSRSTMYLVQLFMVIAVILSLLGLVAMSTYYSDEKSKEIAVRKVFGGTLETETVHNVLSYIYMSLIACAIGIPVAVWAGGRYLQNFSYRVDGYWWVFPAAALLSILISFLSVLVQILRAAGTNPAEELKKE